MIPQVQGKFNSKRTVQPLTLFLKGNQAKSIEEIVPAPESMVLCPSSKLFDFIDKPLSDGPKIMGHNIRINDNIGFFAAPVGFGAPMWTWILEQLIAWGVKKFVFIGFFGQIDPKLDPNNVFIVEKALRDEGTSYHYEKDSTWAYPSEKFNQLFVDQSLKLLPISVWTIDAMFMQTEADIDYGIKNDIAGFEMETSALFTVANFHSCYLSSIQIVSDGYINGEYINFYKTPEFNQRFKEAVDIAVSVLAKSGDNL